MRKFIANTFLVIAVIATICANAQDTTRLVVNIAGGFGQEKLDWTIAGNLQGKNPNILSELKWKDVRGPHFHIDVILRVKRRFLISGSSDYQKTTSGTVTDTDYQGDNRTNQSFFILVDADRGYTSNITGQVGYDLMLRKGFSLQPWIGYTRDQMLLYLFDDQSFGDQKLNSTYENYWKGMLLGLSAHLKIFNRFSAAITFQYRQLRYDATANWNLIAEFEHPKSFTHYAKGFGITNTAKLDYQLSRTLSVFFQGKYAFLETGKGVDTVFFTSGQTEKTQLNGVQRKNFGVTVGISIRI